MRRLGWRCGYLYFLPLKKISVFVFTLLSQLCEWRRWGRNWHWPCQTGSRVGVCVCEMLCAQCRCVSLLTCLVTVMLREHSGGSNDRVAFYTVWFKVSHTKMREMSSWFLRMMSCSLLLRFFSLRMTLLLVFSDLKPHCTLSLYVISSFAHFQLPKNLCGCHILYFLFVLCSTKST